MRSTLAREGEVDVMSGLAILGLVAGGKGDDDGGVATTDEAIVEE